MREKIEKYVTEKIMNTPYECLDFQKKMIVDGVQFFLVSFFLKPFILRMIFDDNLNNEEIKNFVLEKCGDVSNNTFFKKAHITLDDLIVIQTENIFYSPFPVFTLDVGIGKTLIGLLSIDAALHFLWGDKLNVMVIIPPLMKEFYQNTINNLNLTQNYTFITHTRQLTNKKLIDNKRITSKFISKKHLAISDEFDEWIGERKWDIAKSDIKKSFALQSHQYVAFALIDEFTSPVNPFLGHVFTEVDTELPPFSFLNEKINLTSVFGFGLSASKNHFLYANNSNHRGLPYYMFSMPSEFIKKEDVLNELEWKWLYRQNHLLVKMYESNIKDCENFWDMYKQIQENYLAIRQQSRNFFDEARLIIRRLAQNIDLNQTNSLIELIENYFNNKKVEIKALKKEEIKLTNKMKSLKNKKFYSKAISNYFQDMPLVELQDKKILILLDKNWNRSKLQGLRKWLIDNKFILLDEHSHQEYQSGVLVGTLDELGRWGNFQEFDTLVMMYISDINLEDLHQFLGRIDRINSKGEMKNVYLFSYLQNTKFIEHMLRERKNLSSEKFIAEVIFQEKEKEMYQSIVQSQQDLVKTTESFKIELQQSFANTTIHDYGQKLLNNLAQDISNKVKHYLAFTNGWNLEDELLSYVLKVLKENKPMIDMLYQNELFE